MLKPSTPAVFALPASILLIVFAFAIARGVFDPEPMHDIHFLLPPALPEGERYRSIYLAPRFEKLVIVFPDGTQSTVTLQELAGRAK